MIFQHATPPTQARWVDGDSLWLRMTLGPDLIRYVVPKGYVALDGVSLTVCDVDVVGGSFTVMLITHTQRHVTLPTRVVGDFINVEVDVMGKYAERGTAELRSRVDALEAMLTSLHSALDARVAALEAGRGQVVAGTQD